MNRTRMKITAAMMMMAVLLAGCATTPLQPWQRGQLAQPVMAWEPDPLLDGYRRHVLVSKEAASGGATLGGGGCGCN